jgi:formylglycine-generating enzyme required for sulfatase activity/dienelactone hydrolase
MDKGNILESWKEIAAHLGRNVRTCQLWERQHGLPIHRLDGSPKARVFAYTAELDRWFHDKLREGASNGGRVKNGRPALPTLPRWNIGLIAGLAVLAAAAVATSAWLLDRQAKVRWANDVALPEIERLLLISENEKVFDLALKAQKVIPGSHQLARLMPQAAGTLTVKTTPPGAEISIAPYGRTETLWEALGPTPLVDKRLCQGYRRWKLVKPGYETVEGTIFIRPGIPRTLELTLQGTGEALPGMVHIDAGTFAPNFFNLTPQASVVLPGYSIDTYEVTNRRFKGFVDAGGYARPEYWRQPFVKDGRTVPWAEAVEGFTDKTGRPGPATWSFGDYPPGEEDYPVSGVSWYEAAAFAEFEGKTLPTLFHWVRAAGDYLTDSGFIIPASNFGGKGPARAGSYPSLGPFGTYDMAGNVKEWCQNETGDKRFIIGGGWDENEYMFGVFDARDPFRREADFGFRCLKAEPGSPYGPELSAPLETMPQMDFTTRVPCGDEIYRAYAGLFAYTKLDLRPKVESRQEWSDRTVVEKVTFDDAVGGSRMVAYLFLPKQGHPPFQTVVYFPGVGGQRISSIFDYGTVKNREVDLFTSSGRAFVFPVLAGTFERRDGSVQPQTLEQHRDYRIRVIRDFVRTLDYLETRPDIDADRLAFLGLSWGGYLGSQVLALETRLKAAVFLAGGLDQEDYQPTTYSPEIDVINFIPRARAPVLIIHGRYDFISPLRTEPTTILKLLGTPEKDKTLIIKETGHNVWQLNETRKDTFDWLDKYLGPVDRRASVTGPGK